MKNRIATGLFVFGAYLILALLDLYWVSFAIFAVLLWFAVGEAACLWGVEDEAMALKLVSLIFFCVLPFAGGAASGFMAGALALIAMAGLAAFKMSERLNSAIIIIYPTIPLFMVFEVYHHFGIAMLSWLIFTVVATDSAAYFGGKMLGKTPFSPASPNKTAEGTAIGVAAGTLIGWVFGMIFIDITAIAVLFTSFLMAAFGVFGDLFESWMKRRAGVKDSGTLFGSHGGVLDRLDGLMFAVFALLAVILQ